MQKHAPNFYGINHHTPRIVDKLCWLNNGPVNCFSIKKNVGKLYFLALKVNE